MNKLIFRILGILLIVTSFFSNIKAQQTDRDKGIVLIFDKNPVANQRKNGPYTLNHVRYYSDNLTRTEVLIDNKNKIDTVQIGATKENLPVDIFHNYIVFSYHFRQGDTLTFSFKNDVPLVVKVNRKVRAFDLNFTLLSKQMFKEQLVGSNMLRMVPSLAKDKQFSKLYTSYSNRKKFIDSLYNADLLSSELYHIYSVQNECQYLWAPVFNNNLSPFSDSIQKQFPKEVIINNNSLLYNDFFHNFLTGVYLWSDDLGIAKIRGTQSINLNYNEAYDKVEANVKDELIKNCLLFHCLQKIHELGNANDFGVYLNKFRTNVRDPRFDGYIRQNFDDFLIDRSGSTLLANTQKTKKTEFTELIKSLKGNVLYIDLWASWCAPCRAAMPASRKLRTTFSGKAVKFIYISVDAQFGDWAKAAGEEKLINDPNSWLMLDIKNAHLKKQFNIASIPRYLIFDKKGKLVYQNAPGPEKTETKDLLDRYLSEK